MGFARGVHAAYNAATGNLIVLLNNDTETAPTWLEELVAAANKHPEAGYLRARSYCIRIAIASTLRVTIMAWTAYPAIAVSGSGTVLI